VCQIYQAKQKPRYFIGHTISFGCVALRTVLVIIFRFILVMINRRQKRMTGEEIKKEVEKYGGEGLAKDHHPELRYTF